MTTIRPQVEAFSLKYARITDRETSFLDAIAETLIDSSMEFYGVNESSVEPDADSYQNEGNDAILSVWNWLNGAAVTVQAGYISFPLMAKMTGRPVVSTLSGEKQTLQTDLWHEDSFNVPPFPMIIHMPAKDADGNPLGLYFGLYKVQFAPITFDGPAYKDGLKVNYAGTAMLSDRDETGMPFEDGKRRIGTLITTEL